MDYTRNWEAPPPAPVPNPSAAHAPPAHHHLTTVPYHDHHPPPQPHQYSSYPAAHYPDPNPNHNPSANPDHPPPADPYYYHHRHQQQEPYSVPHSSSSYLPASYAYPKPSPAPAPVAAAKPDNAFTSISPAPAPPEDPYHYPPPLPPSQTQSGSHSQPSYLVSYSYLNPAPAAKPDYAPSSAYVPPPDPYAPGPNAGGYECLRHHAGATYTDPGLGHHHHASGSYLDLGLNHHHADEGNRRAGVPYLDPGLNYHHAYAGHHHAIVPYSDTVLGPAAPVPYSDSGLRPVTPLSAHYYNTARGGEGGGYAGSSGVMEAIRQHSVDPLSYETPTLVSNQLDPVLSSNPILAHWNNMTFPASKEATKKHPKRAKMMKTAYCQVCKIECNSTDILKTHKQGKKHKKNLLKLQEAITAKPAKALAAAGVKKEKESLGANDKAASEQRKKRAAPYTPAATDDELEMKKKVVLDGGAAPDEIRVCTVCNVVVNSQQVLEFHIAGQKHAAMVKKQQEAAQLS